MPLDVPIEYEANYWQVITYLNFCMGYTNWKRDIPLSCLSLLPFYIVRLLTCDKIERLLAIMVINLIWLSLTLFATHIAITKIGMIVAENSVLCLGSN